MGAEDTGQTGGGGAALDGALVARLAALAGAPLDAARAEAAAADFAGRLPGLRALDAHVQQAGLVPLPLGLVFPAEASR